MRVSTALISQVSLAAMLDQQKKMSDTQLQVSTGKKLLAPSDDPYGSARTLDLNETIGLNTQYQENAGHAKNRLALEEGTLEGFNTAVQRIRELMIAGNNDSQTIESRAFISEEIEQLLDQVLSLSNATDSNGEYIFGGYQGKTKPFEADGVGNFLFYGDSGQRFLKVGSSTSVAIGDSGQDAFVAVKNGNGTFQTLDDSNNKGSGIIDPGSVSGNYVADNYKIKFLPPSSGSSIDPVEYYVLDGGDNIIEPAAQAGMAEAAFIAGANPGIQFEEGAVIAGLDTLGVKTSITGSPTANAGPPLEQDVFTISPSNHQSIFSTIQNFIDTLRGPQSTSSDLAAFHNKMNRAIVDIDQGMGRILEVRARIGARLNTVDKQLEINEAFTLQMKTTLSGIQDLDYASAITQLNLQLTGLQAAQSAYTKIQGLTLFNYL